MADIWGGVWKTFSINYWRIDIAIYDMKEHVRAFFYFFHTNQPLATQQGTSLLVKPQHLNIAGRIWLYFLPW